MALSARRAPAAAWASRRRAGSGRRRRPGRCGGERVSPPPPPSPPRRLRPPGIAAAAPGTRRRCAARAAGRSGRVSATVSGRRARQGFRQPAARALAAMAAMGVLESGPSLRIRSPGRHQAPHSCTRPSAAREVMNQRAGAQQPNAGGAEPRGPGRRARRADGSQISAAGSLARRRRRTGRRAARGRVLRLAAVGAAVPIA